MLMRKDFKLDLNNIEFIIKKFRKPKGREKPYGYIKPLYHHKYRLQITDACEWLYNYAGIIAISVMSNHEILHAILAEFIGIRHGMKEYDEFLKWKGLYDFDICVDLWL